MQDDQTHDACRAPSLTMLFSSFLRMGITAFGGPAMIAYIRKMAVVQKQWLDGESFQDGVALCQVIPGATVMQMAAYIGLKVRGVRGAMVSYIGFGLPAFFLMMVLSVLYSVTHSLPTVASVFSGLQAVIVAVVANAAVSFGKTSIKRWKDVLITGIAAGLFWLMANPMLIILLAALLGMLLSSRQQPNLRIGHEIKMSATTRPLLLFLLGTVAGFGLLYFLRKDLFQLAMLMSKIDIIAFGGGFASVPLMFHEIVEIRSWMDGPTFLNGIVLGQFTPGPIVITATFVGYLVHGFLGAIVATVAIFLPSFLILVGVAPYFDRLRASPWFARAIGGILCSFVGLLLMVTIRFALNVHWDFPHMALAGAAFVALLLKLDILWVVLAGTAISILNF
ncbi:MAG: chromate efflux transporter [Deltaproteobacteria bacterium]|nr:chromate efflux transporter [Deltaproteobacteria bacterium]